MSGPKVVTRDLYDASMGDDVRGTSMTFNHETGGTHNVVYGDDRHFSWDTDKDGNVSGVHGTEHDKPDNRPW